ncbi:hypothetical protein BH24BAC1_BH24BAC1_32210 [soil metagenome]
MGARDISNSTAIPQSQIQANTHTCYPGFSSYVGQDSLFEQHYDLGMDGTLDSASPRFMLQVSARLLGHHMQTITKCSQSLHQRIRQLADDKIRAFSRE